MSYFRVMSCFCCIIVIQRSFATKDLEYTHVYVHETLRYALDDIKEKDIPDG